MLTIASKTSFLQRLSLLALACGLLLGCEKKHLPSAGKALPSPLTPEERLPLLAPITAAEATKDPSVQNHNLNIFVLKTHYYKTRPVLVLALQARNLNELRLIAQTDYTEYAFCHLGDSPAQCEEQKHQPFLFSDASHSHLPLIGDLASVFMRTCTRLRDAGSSEATGEASCSRWFLLDPPSAFKRPPQPGSAPIEEHLTQAHQIQEDLRSECGLLHSTYREYQAPAKAAALQGTFWSTLAQNGLTMGLDHCYFVMETPELGLLKEAVDQVIVQSSSEPSSEPAVNSSSPKLALSGDSGDHKVAGMDSGLFNVLLGSFAVISVARLALPQAIGHCTSCMAKLKKSPGVQKAINASAFALLLAEAGLAATSIISHSENPDGPFPIVSTMVLTVVAAELVTMAVDAKLHRSASIESVKTPENSSTKKLEGPLAGPNATLDPAALRAQSVAVIDQSVERLNEALSKQPELKFETNSDLRPTDLQAADLQIRLGQQRLRNDADLDALQRTKLSDDLAAMSNLVEANRLKPGYSDSLSASRHRLHAIHLLLGVTAAALGVLEIVNLTTGHGIDASLSLASEKAIEKQRIIDEFKKLVRQRVLHISALQNQLLTVRLQLAND